jgi:hypothetical protein
MDFLNNLNHVLRNLLYHLYKILVILIKNWSLISWDMSEIDLPIIKLVYFLFIINSHTNWII